MKTRLVSIGNSRGIRIPKALIEQIGFTDEADLAVKNGALVIRPHRHPRAGWAEAFAAMHDHNDDRLLDTATPTEWDEDDWQW